MSAINKYALQLTTIIMVMSAVSCVTETVESPAIKFDEAAVISVGDPQAAVATGSTFAWLPEAVRFYDDERLDNEPLRSLIEDEIVNNIKNKEMLFVDSVSGARYSIAYTAALESSLDDATIVRRFGLLPGMARVPQGDDSVEKGSLIIYVFNNKSGDIIWRSAAQVSVGFDTSMAQRKDRVVRVLAEMFQTFPTASRAAR